LALFLEAAGLQTQPRFLIWHSKAITSLASLAGGEPLETWKEWLAYHAIEDAAPWLPKAFAREHFAFYST
jgi:predicted metalloendopeptidase